VAPVFSNATSIEINLCEMVKSMIGVAIPVAERILPVTD
jgi:hypothetical protein